jgi:SpoIID/LytB domain protein
VAPVHLWVRDPASGKPVGTIPVGATWVVKAVGGAYEIDDETGAIVGGHTWGSATANLYATYVDDGARVTVPEGGATYSHGFLEFNLNACVNACAMRLILQVPFEQYLLGIGEVPSSWPMEALKAQAIAARSYALYKMTNYGVQPSCNCDLYDDSNDQVYIGWDKEGGADGSRWVSAVRSTAGTIVSYQGAVALTVYTASDGGHTENIDVQWGTPLSSYPYLAGVCDPGDYSAANPWSDWKRQFSADQLTKALIPYTGKIGPVSGFGAIERGVSGRIVDAVVHGATGDVTITGADLRTALSLPDDRVWVNADKNVLGGIRTKYDTLMCQPGLPTTVALSVPSGSRQRFTDGAIYENTTVPVTVWLRGAIYQEYLVAGGASGVLGPPIADPLNVAALRGVSCPSGCTRADFEHGRIYWKAELGAFASWGGVLTSYLDHGGAGGKLGFPTSSVHRGSHGAVFATFEGGKITCPKNGAACVVKPSA